MAAAQQYLLAARQLRNEGVESKARRQYEQAASLLVHLTRTDALPRIRTAIAKHDAAGNSEKAMSRFSLAAEFANASKCYRLLAEAKFGSGQEPEKAQRYGELAVEFLQKEIATLAEEAQGRPSEAAATGR